MKRCLVLFLMLLVLAGCSRVDTETPVFTTEGITAVAFITYPTSPEGIPVSEQYLAAITEWLGTFRLESRVKDDVLPPGSNSIRVRIQYADGTVVENGLSTMKLNGVHYFLQHADAPACYSEILSLT